MGKGFLTKLLQKLVGTPVPSPGKDPVKTPIFSAAALRTLNEKWGEAPLIQLGAFMQSYREALDAAPQEKQRDGGLIRAPDYFTTLTRLQSKMLKGALPFSYPKVGTYDYPEKDMFFAEHCYVPVPDLIAMAQKLENEGNRNGAEVFAQALTRATQKETPKQADKLIWEGYEYECGNGPKQKFFLSAYETGGSFATVLRHQAPQQNNNKPSGPR